MNRAVARGLVGAIPLGIVLASVACAARFYVPPTGPGAPFAEAGAVWQEVTARCRDADRFVAEISVNGWVGEGQSRQSVNAPIHGALTREDDIYLEVRALGGLYVQMAGRGGQAVFLLPRDERVLQAPSRDIVEALTGLRWGAKDLLTVLSGCVAPPAAEVTGVSYGERAAIELGGDARAWVQQRDGAWQLDAATRDGLLIEYRAREGAFPSDVRVSSLAPGITPLQLTFAITQVQVNIDLPSSTFVLAVPQHFVPMTLADLRAARPLRNEKDAR